MVWMMSRVLWLASSVSDMITRTWNCAGLGGRGTRGLLGALGARWMATQSAALRPRV